MRHAINVRLVANPDRESEFSGDSHRDNRVTGPEIDFDLLELSNFAAGAVNLDPIAESRQRCCFLSRHCMAVFLPSLLMK
jgi:hypothetical protein